VWIFGREGWEGLLWFLKPGSCTPSSPIFFQLISRHSVAYTLGQYAEFRQDGRREIPHPVGIEPSHSSAKFRKQKENTGGFWGRFWGNNGTPEIGEGRTKVEWTHEPPKEVVYHDWAFWADKEVKFCII